MNLVMLLEMARSGFGDRVALTSGAESFTYAELFDAAGAAAAALRASGARHAALLDESSPALPVALFASAWAGLPFAPLNYRLTADELDALLARVAPAYLVTDADRAMPQARTGTWIKQARRRRTLGAVRAAAAWMTSLAIVGLVVATAAVLLGVPRDLNSLSQLATFLLNH